MRKIATTICFFFMALGLLPAQERVTIMASDSVEVTADWYFQSEEFPLLILCHQAGWSRGEYLETAKWLNTQGYNCLAIDQRSGDAVNNVPNMTAALAKKMGKNGSYVDALPDIRAAVDWAIGKSGRGVILVGSSYSAGLVLKIAKENDMVMAVASFSPGEYYGDKLKLGKSIDGLSKPTFITASKREMGPMRDITMHIAPEMLTTYTPPVEGQHGSRALWTTKPGYEGYRKAFLEWLVKVNQ
jgi:dienelactone hydrolase